MPTYTISTYIESKSTLLEKIQAIDLLIEQMTLRIGEVAEGAGSTVDEYSLDTGQMKIRTSYRSVKDVENGINALEKMKQRYVNRFNGRVTVLRDVRGLS